MNNKANQSDLLVAALSSLAADKTISIADAIVFSGDIVSSLSRCVDPNDSLILGGACCNPDIDTSYGNRRAGHMPSTKPINDADTGVQPLGTPTPASIVDKIDTKTKAKTMNILLHSFWKLLKTNAQSEMALNKENLIMAHTALVEKMKSNGWTHPYMDALDDTLPSHLRGTIVGPASPSKEKSTGPEREPITVAPTEDTDKISSTLNVALPEVTVDANSYFKLKKQDVNKFLGDDAANEITATLPDDALYLLVDAVETGTFNKVEISKEELDNAAPGYAGRMFVEGHEWNNPQKAIGQILKATVVFSPQKGKWVMRVLAVVLRKDAIENFERGLYKFVSIGATMKAICTVCGLTVQDGCRHIKGMIYEGANGTKVECKYKAAELQMEELSAVNVPACRAASAYGKISKEQARELLAASLESTSGGEIVALEAAIELQELIYGDNKLTQTKGELKNMTNWQKEFRISDAQGYNNLMQQASQELMLSRAYGDLIGHRAIAKQPETLLFAHELLHRWFNQPSRAHGWTEEAIAQKHIEIEEELLAQGLEMPDVSVMDSVLHAKAKSLKDASAAAVPAAGAVGPDVALDFPPVDEKKPKKASSPKPKEEDDDEIPENDEIEQFGKNKCDTQDNPEDEDELPEGDIDLPLDEESCKKTLNAKCSDEDEDDNNDDDQVPSSFDESEQTLGAKCMTDIVEDEDDENNEENCKKNQKTLNTDKLFNKNNIVDSEIPDDGEENDEDMQNKKHDQNSPEVEYEAISLNDACTRRAGYQDGVAKAQAGETKARGKNQNVGNDLPIKDGDYRHGYESGYKEAKKHAEPNYVDDQISKTGGTEMAVENTEKVVLEKAQKDEAKKSGAVKDLGTRKEQGVAKPEVKYTDEEKYDRKDNSGDTNSTTHEYDAKKGHAKAEVQYKEQKQDGANYGYLKCPKCNTGNIMQDSAKCPNCGAPHSELIPIKTEERMGDFPYMKTHTAYDAPPMEAKTPGVATPAAQKSKLSMEDETNLSSIQNEMKLMKEHISKITNQSEAERESWYAERRELVNANQGLSDALTATRDEVDSLRLDLDTKSSMYKTLLGEYQTLLKQVEEHANFAKKQLVDEMISAKINLGLLDDDGSEAQAQYYMEKPIETLRVLHEEVTANSQRISDIVLQSKFGVPKELKDMDNKEKPAKCDTTEGVKVSKGEAVDSKEEAKKQQAIADEMASKEDIEKAAKELGELTQGVKQTETNSIMAKVRRSLTNDRRTR